MIQSPTSIPEPVTQELLFIGQLSRNTFAHFNHSLSIQDEASQHYVKKQITLIMHFHHIIDSVIM